ncbi:MAG: GntR family transcriptional regulator [Pseudomonadota bacterium]
MAAKILRRQRTLDGDEGVAPEPTRSAEIRLVLEEEILSGLLRPGDHLNELVLGERFSASRTPIREAIRQLEAQSLVEIVPRKGAFVARISLQNLLEMFELMAELESVCARLAAERITPEQKAQLMALHADYEPLAKSPKDAERYFEVSSGFHRQIFAATQNTALAELANTTYDRLLAYRRKQLGKEHRSPQSFKEHSAVLEAILRGDGEAAAKKMRDHSGEVRGNALDLLRKLTT